MQQIENTQMSKYSSRVGGGGGEFKLKNCEVWLQYKHAWQFVSNAPIRYSLPTGFLNSFRFFF